MKNRIKLWLRFVPDLVATLFGKFKPVPRYIVTVRSEISQERHARIMLDMKQFHPSAHVLVVSGQDVEVAMVSGKSPKVISGEEAEQKPKAEKRTIRTKISILARAVWARGSHLRVIADSGTVIARLARAVWAWGSGCIPEFCWLAGGSVLYLGIHDIYPPAAKIIIGCIVLFAGWRLARQTPRDDNA